MDNRQKNNELERIECRFNDELIEHINNPDSSNSTTTLWPWKTFAGCRTETADCHIEGRNADAVGIFQLWRPRFWDWSTKHKIDKSEAPSRYTISLPATYWQEVEQQARRWIEEASKKALAHHNEGAERGSSWWRGKFTNMLDLLYTRSMQPCQSEQAAWNTCTTETLRACHATWTRLFITRQEAFQDEIWHTTEASQEDPPS